MCSSDLYEATQMIRQSPQESIRTLPILALTASAIKGDKERALSAGMVDYLVKPVKRAELESAICRWLYDQATRQALAKFDLLSLKSSERERPPTMVSHLVV